MLELKKILSTVPWQSTCLRPSSGRGHSHMSYSVVAFGWDEGSGVFQPMWGLLNTMAEGYLTPAGRVFLFWPLLQIGSSDHGPQSHIHSSIRTSQPRQGQGSYQRTTFRDLANALGAKSILYNLFKEGYFRRQNNDLNFSLIDENKKSMCMILFVHDECLVFQTNDQYCVHWWKTGL
jgi:hypothetical protein